MDDPRHAPLYSIPECARYLGLPVSTVWSWVTPAVAEPNSYGRPLVHPAESDPTALSFTNLVELYVLMTLRRKYKMTVKEIRWQIDSAMVKHSLASPEFLTNGFQERVELDDLGFAERFYPFTRGYGRDDPRIVVIDPMVSFGRPIVAGSGVRTEVIAKLVKAGEDILELADDYRLKPAQIEEAVRYELAV